MRVLRKVQKAANALGIAPEGLTSESVKEHYALLVKSLHPDSPDRVAGLSTTMSLEQLRQAKDYLVKYLEKENG